MAVLNDVVTSLNSQFALKDLGAVNFFLGFEVVKHGLGYHLTQRKYTTDPLAKTAMLGSTPSPTLMCQSKKLSVERGDVLEQP